MNKTITIDFNNAIDCYYYVNDNNTTDTNKSHVTGCANFYDQFAKNVNIAKQCLGKAYENGCVPKYSKYFTGTGCTGFTESYINLYSHVYNLSNGIIIIVYNPIYPLFLVDINGFKGPNKPGYDLFSFGINRNPKKGYYLRERICSFKDTGGKSTSAMMKYSFAN